MHDVEALRRAAEYAAGKREQPTRTRKSKDERRRARRVPYASEGTGNLRPGAPSARSRIKKDFPVVTTSLSQSGISFLANYELEPECVVELTLPASGGKNRRLYVEVRYCRRAGLNAFEAGGEFTEST